MIRIFHRVGGEILQEKSVEALDNIPVDNLLWIDLRDYEKNERENVELKLGIKLQTATEAAEIESSSRYFETFDTIYLNNTFLLQQEKGYSGIPVSFAIKNDVLITARNGDIKVFFETVKKIKSNTRIFKTGYQVLTSIFETRIDLDADMLEGIARDISFIGKEITIKKELDEEQIIKITALQETTMMLRESIVDTQRVISALLKSELFPNESLGKLRVMVKDTGSLLNHTSFSFERLEYLQNTFLGLLNIEQNKTIKIFTVVSVIFMPPTLIASMYGMNFAILPEKDWKYGYPFAIALMILSSLITLYIFRRKKWL
ncbi:MAG: magnesium/cobalt transporter CorA [Bacteroidota bacterium]|jgi:magnesium transporter